MGRCSGCWANRQVEDQPGRQARGARCAIRLSITWTFSYDGGREILTTVSFEVPPGKKDPVVGSRRLGQSTLARLLVRFYDVAAGASPSTP